MTSPLIRPRTIEDLPACVDALATVHASDRYPVNWPADPGRWLTPSNLVAAWVVVNGADVLGHVGLSQPDAATLEPLLAQAIGMPAGPVGSLTRLFVTPPGRGHGHATRLLDVVAKKAADLGIPLVLDVSDDDHGAITLYERAGWQRVATTRAEWLNAAGENALLHHYVSPETMRKPAQSE
ncbi:GNAT family N-acetyltransferase [Microbispora hainanensis]|uniref:GNAT family N-acetyltransferase n=1 Tax=Microbispora hainanensis TaxID=568844 RepID=A0A544YZH6_9ACTN|nr:GNAT family N-acetyltransferase [Microbispora hainanensis]TQS22141.1 GNAT family N-acetyltransferase [Microbispora hainanensis]